MRRSGMPRPRRSRRAHPHCSSWTTRRCPPDRRRIWTVRSSSSRASGKPSRPPSSRPGCGCCSRPNPPGRSWPRSSARPGCPGTSPSTTGCSPTSSASARIRAGCPPSSKRPRSASARPWEIPRASLDSQPKLLRSLHRVGILVESTSRWELAEQTHPVIEPLLEYKKLSRLLSANGWNWLDEWIDRGQIPARLRAGGGRHRTLGLVRRRCAAAAPAAAQRGPLRSGLAPRGRRRGTARAAGARRHGARRGARRGRARP